MQPVCRVTKVLIGMLAEASEEGSGVAQGK